MIKYLITFLLIGFSAKLSAQVLGLKFGEISNPKKGMNYYTFYTASTGETFKLNQKVKVGFPSSKKTFAFIYH